MHRRPAAPGRWDPCRKAHAGRAGVPGRARTGLLAYESNSWLTPTARHEPFLHAVLGAWSELDAVGPRYCYSFYGVRLWSVHTNLHYALANMGVPTEILNAPLPAEGPRALLRYVRAAN